MTVIMGHGEDKRYVARLKAVHALGRDLSEQEVASLSDLLYRKQGEDSLPMDQLNALKNDVVNILKLQHRKPQTLARLLMALHNDRSQDVVWRDYCVQHLGSIYDQMDDSQEKAWAQGLIWKATTETDSSIAGTALIALANNTGEAGIDAAAVAEKALALCQDPRAGEAARITALQICATLDEKRALPLARGMAESARSAMVKMSAIAAIGTLGDESDRALLGTYVASSDVRLRKSARSALKRMDERARSGR